MLKSNPLVSGPYGHRKWRSGRRLKKHSAGGCTLRSLHAVVSCSMTCLQKCAFPPEIYLRYRYVRYWHSLEIEKLRPVNGWVKVLHNNGGCKAVACSMAWLTVVQIIIGLTLATEITWCFVTYPPRLSYTVVQRSIKIWTLGLLLLKATSKKRMTVLFIATYAFC